MDVYKGWAEKSEELWFERVKQLPQVEALLRVARAAEEAVEGVRPLFLESERLEVMSPAMLKVLVEALEEVKDIL